MTSLRNAGRFDEEFPTFYRKEKDEKEAFDEGVFVSDFLNDEEQEDEDVLREPRAQFENYLSKLDGATQFLIHDLVRNQ